MVLEEAEGTDKNEGLKEAGSETRCLEPEGEYTVSVIKLARAKKLARFFTTMVSHEAETFLNVFFTQIIVLHLVFKESF